MPRRSGDTLTIGKLRFYDFADREIEPLQAGSSSSNASDAVWGNSSVQLGKDHGEFWIGAEFWFSVYPAKIRFVQPGAASD